MLLERATSRSYKGKGKKERNWKDEERGLILTSMRTEPIVAYCQMDDQMSYEYDNTGDDYKIKLDILGEEFRL